VSGTKAYYGHPLGASAAIEGVVCALAIRESLVPPTLNYQTPDPICDLDVVPNEPREKEVNYVLSNAFGFGGINSCVIYKKVRLSNSTRIIVATHQAVISDSGGQRA
jgi:3-oxoacyl-(acyl-carrier-protein) synthase